MPPKKILKGVVKKVVKEEFKEELKEEVKEKEAKTSRNIEELIKKTGILTEDEKINELVKNVKELTESEEESLALIYELLGMIKEEGFEEVMKMKRRNKKEWIFLQKGLEKSLRENIFRLKVNKEKMEIKSGLFKCRRCGSNRTVSMEIQLRRADEPMSIVVTCIDCEFKWVIS